jgi:hypothetical protein
MLVDIDGSCQKSVHDFLTRASSNTQAAAKPLILTLFLGIFLHKRMGTYITWQLSATLGGDLGVGRWGGGEAGRRSGRAG